jgi:hypothetical protein
MFAPFSAKVQPPDPQVRSKGNNLLRYIKLLPDLSGGGADGNSKMYFDIRAPVYPLSACVDIISRTGIFPKMRIWYDD